MNKTKPEIINIFGYDILRVFDNQTNDYVYSVSPIAWDGLRKIFGERYAGLSIPDIIRRVCNE